MNKIIDVHGHCGYSFFPISIEWGKDIVNMMDRYGIDKLIVSNFRGIFYEMTDANHEVEQTISPYQGRLYGYIVVNPHYLKESLYDIEYYSQKQGFVAVKMHPAWHQCKVNSKKYEPLFALCNDMKFPIMAHSFISEAIGDQVSAPERLADIASKYPNPIVMGHMGGNHNRGIAAAKGVENLYLEISGGRQDADSESIWIPQRVRLAIQELGVEKLMFGSDLPLVDPAISLGIMKDTDLTEEEKASIMYKNAEKVFFNRDV